MHPTTELSAKYAAKLADYLPDSDDRAALAEVVSNAIWCGDDVAAPFAGALLGVVERVAIAVYDAIEQGECDRERFRSWIGGSLEALAEQIAGVERSITIIAPGTGHV